MVTAVLVAAATTTILMTSGRAAATEEAVLRTVDQQGTRTLVIQSTGDSPLLATQLVDTIATIPLVETVVGFGPVRDVTAAALPDGTRVGARLAYGVIGNVQATPRTPNEATVQLAWLSMQASRTLGLPPGAGTIRIIDGPEYTVAGVVTPPDYLQSFEPLVVIPTPADPHGKASLSTIVILAKSPEDVAFLGKTVAPLLSELPDENVSLSSSERLATLRQAIGGELTKQARVIVLAVLAISTAISLVIVWGFVLGRRKDLGRRRALGATRATIIALVVGQVALTAALASTMGALFCTATLSMLNTQIPRPSYVMAVVVGLTATAALAASVPATYAANRDPLHELRVP
ncbi:hypothetical protein H9L10_13145 [Phycicoccus endophyticus]|uniref:ABC3 transporter permease C-terminal domain-containing protein n=1 Tax=Phycicoccus endophyticus TaxID=1690220 RepID=A0A7G9R0N7_9MICO|nr:FtsX-like permease family protein [Phycicoccus endophyticus]NHI19443.1 hypothetical protein [Phycicoccus endophyticus]QNN49162.1 hypothetical protein H9L10_13145 [Phycicoccus endophyticus]